MQVSHTPKRRGMLRLQARYVIGLSNFPNVTGNRRRDRFSDTPHECDSHTVRFSTVAFIECIQHGTAERGALYRRAIIHTELGCTQTRHGVTDVEIIACCSSENLQKPPCWRRARLPRQNSRLIYTCDTCVRYRTSKAPSGRFPHRQMREEKSMKNQVNVCRMRPGRNRFIQRRTSIHELFN